MIPLCPECQCRLQPGLHEGWCSAWSYGDRMPPPAYCKARNLRPYDPRDCRSPDCSCVPSNRQTDAIMDAAFTPEALGLSPKMMPRAEIVAHLRTYQDVGSCPVCGMGVEKLHADGCAFHAAYFALPPSEQTRVAYESLHPQVPVVDACVDPDSRSWSQHLWSRLGFGLARPPEMPDKEGFVPGCGCSEIYFVLDWRDWLRVLISGKVSVAIAHKMDAMPKRWESASELSVLPPGYRQDGWRRFKGDV